MCDGSLSQRVLEYDKDSIEKVGDSYSIDGKAYGTPLVTSFHVTDPDWGALDQELSTLEKRQDGLKNRGGNVEADISFITGEDEELPMPEESPEVEESLEAEESPEAKESLEAEEFPEAEESLEAEESPDVNQSPDRGDGAGAGLPTKDEAGQAASRFTITANSALSEYLAIQMLNTEQEIDISAFPEAADTSLVVDAFLEAQYQNPLILGIKGAGMDTDNRILRVMYDYDAETTEAKRKEVEEKVTRITDEIIKDGMSELEKEIAINQYLCDNARYDDGALENAAEHDFQYVDDSYNDSFTAYGVLVNQIGVCASYSAGFKLLADAAGLDSIVVTGYLEGNLPHAWNKVRLDGQWNIVDSTNNDNDMIQNALFNLSDSAAYSILAEDDRFVLDGNVYDYEAPSDEKEYYCINDNYFSMDQITDILAEKLNSEGRAAVRTDYDLDDESFNRIAQETANQTHSRLTGFHWMGVIHLEQK